jgi:hypothetical protein
MQLRDNDFAWSGLTRCNVKYRCLVISSCLHGYSRNIRIAVSEERG